MSLKLIVITVRVGDGIHQPPGGSEQAGLLERLTGEPTWFTADVTLWVLGVLSLAEILADKWLPLRELLDTLRANLSAGLAALTYFGVLSATDAAFAGGAVVHAAGFGDFIGMGFTGASAWMLAEARGRVFSVLSDADDGDVSGLRRILSWGEDLRVGLGVFVAVLFPFVMSPPPLIAHLLRQELVKRSPMLKTVLKRHPNAPRDARQ